MSETDPTALLREIAFGDLKRELAVTRTVLERVPAEHFDWKPHAKSMSLLQLATHVADMPDWMVRTLDHDDLDMASAPQRPPAVTNREELLSRLDRGTAAVRECVARFDMSRLTGQWTMRNGTQVMVTRPRWHVFRIWCVNHMIHHRGQVCLYLRLLNVPVPTVYFNTADDPTWVFA
jgi:uncharacterized damage-inducible protein DinB